MFLTVRTCSVTLLVVLAATEWSGMARAAVPYPPPASWNGINYSPRRHSYFRMLYDWYSMDSKAKKHVYQMVDEDLLRLSQNGYNLVHLYLWDQQLLRMVNASEPAGFISAPGDPSKSPNRQWSALNDFVSRAEARGLYVALHFASGSLIQHMLNGDDPEVTASEFANWSGSFIRYLTPQRKNVLVWGLAYAIMPLPGVPESRWSITWQKAYQKVDAIARSSSPAPGVLGLIGANLQLELLDSTGQPNPHGQVISRDSGYVWGWQTTQRSAKTMNDLLTAAYGQPKHPDIYMMQLYNANSSDIGKTLDSVTAASTIDGIPVPASKIFVVEFATSSSLNASPKGNDVPSWGDAQTPTTSEPGHSQWLSNTLCTFRRLNITKLAYWSLYDPYTLWTGAPWYKTGQDLAWNGFWGLTYESETHGDKPGWSTLRSLYTTNSLPCAAQPEAATPIVSLTRSADYYTVNQPVRLTWTAADVASMALDRTHAASYSCNPDQPNAQLSDDSPAGSCAYTDVAAFAGTGSQAITLTGYNSAGSSATARATITVGQNPTVQSVTDHTGSSRINAEDTIVITGKGFSLTGGNRIQLVRSGYPDVWLYNGDGHYFSDHSHTEISASLAGRVALGTWALFVHNGYSPASARFNVTIYR